MIHIDCKITNWERFSIEDENLPLLKEFLASNPSASSQDLYNWAQRMGFDPSIETQDLSTYMTKEENQGFSVTEISKDGIPLVQV